jgi:O-antigen/teichoic acid export membrane protein
MRRSSFLWTSVFVAIGNGLIALITLGSLRLYTELADVATYGLATLILGVLALAMQIVVQPISSTQIRFHSEHAKLGHADGFTAQALRLCLCAASVMAGAVCVGSLIAQAFGEIDVGIYLLVAIALWLLVSPIRNVLYSRLHAERRMQSLTACRVVEAILTGGAIGLGLLVSRTAATFVWGQVLSIAVAAALAIYLGVRFSFKAPSRALRTEFNRRLRNYGLAFAPMSLLLWGGNLADRYVLEGISGAASVGAYVAAFSIASSGFILSNTLMTDLFRAKLFDAETSSDSRSATRIFCAWLLCFAAISAVGLAIIVIWGHTIARLVLAPEYRAHAYEIMLWIGCGYSINGITGALECRIFSFAGSKSVLGPQLIGALSAVALSFPFITWRGVIGAAEANCVSFAIQCVITLILLTRLLQRNGTLEASVG